MEVVAHFFPPGQPLSFPTANDDFSHQLGRFIVYFALIFWFPADQGFYTCWDPIVAFSCKFALEFAQLFGFLAHIIQGVQMSVYPCVFYHFLWVFHIHCSVWLPVARLARDPPLVVTDNLDFHYLTRWFDLYFHSFFATSESLFGHVFFVFQGIFLYFPFPLVAKIFDYSKTIPLHIPWCFCYFWSELILFNWTPFLCLLVLP